MKIIFEDINDAATIVSGVGGLIGNLAELDSQINKDDCSLFLLSQLCAQVADFLNDNEIAINEALGNTKKKTAGSVRRIPAANQ